MNVLLEGSPISISIFKITQLLMSTVVAYSSVIEVIGGVGWVNDAWDLGRHQAGIVDQRVVVLPVDTVMCGG